MKKLHSLAFYVLVTPAIALGSASVLAAQASSTNPPSENQTTQGSSDSEGSTGSNMKGDMSGKKMKDDMKMSGQSGKQDRNYMDSAPANGMHASNLIGTDVKTAGDEKVGPVNDLLIGQDGQVVAVVVGVGGFLGMGEKNVAISWDKVTKSGTADERQLRIDQTREELKSAPEYKKQK